MINKTLNAVTVALHEEFGDTFHYYLETVQQELETPCFTVDMLNPIERSVNSKHYYRTMPIVVHFFGGVRTDTKKFGYSIGERALMALEYIIIEDRVIRGEDMETQIADGVLQLFVTYRYWTDKSVDESDIMMETEDLNAVVRN